LNKLDTIEEVKREGLESQSNLRYNIKSFEELRSDNVSKES
jgi:hypothetical protein